MEFLACVALVIVAALLIFYLETMQINTQVTTGDMTGSSIVNVTGENSVIANPTILAAQPGVLTVRTNGTSGSLTMNTTSHGISTGDRVDLYWTNTDGTAGKAYGATVGTVASAVVPISSVAGGDALPPAATAINVGIINDATFNVVGDNMQGILITSTVAGYVALANGATDHLVVYVGPGVAYTWNNLSGITNPIATDTVAKLRMSQSSTVGSLTTMKAKAIVA
jgi:hypothetical protein